jgi:aldose 1-epimerase
MEITENIFGHFEGESVIEYSLVNDKGMSVSCLNFGCVITKVLVPDRNGKMENVVLGFDNFEDYLRWSPYFGAVVGRVAGRINGASFKLDGKEYSLAKNAAPNHIHGGDKGFNSVIWKTEKLEEHNLVGLKFYYMSKDGEEGYPGNLKTIVTYLLNNSNELIITYEAESDQKTIVNLTNHSYFNLSGDVKRDCAEHVLKLDNNGFLELGTKNIPTGRILDSANTVFDFRYGRKIKDGILSDHSQTVLVGNGYDHPLVFDGNEEINTMELSEAESGRHLVVTTDQPCVVLYTSNKLEGPYSIWGVPASNYLGVCLETQGFPDAIHHEHFPSIILEPNQLYFSKTSYRFLV